MMFSIKRHIRISLLCLIALWPGLTVAQNSQLGLTIGVSSWLTNCDIPAGGRDSGFHPAFGPFLILDYGKIRVAGTLFIGTFDVEPHDGLTRISDTVVFVDEEARKRGFTPNGETQRLDFEFSVGYEFSRYAQLSFGLVMNRHEGNVDTFWFPTVDNGELTLPRDPERTAPLKYTDTQYWLGQAFRGSAPINLVSNRFSFFYNVSLLVIAGETGSGTVTHPSGDTTFVVGPRVTYTSETGELAFPPRSLEPRSFGSNAGFAFSTGFGFELFRKPSTVFFIGYNYKFFGESETDLIDRSVFKGPYAGIGIRIL